MEQGFSADFPVCEVFLSCKQTAEDGRRTRDSELAEGLERALGKRGIAAFRAESTLQAQGRADYSRAIARALEQACMLVVVASSGDHAASEWVRFEWETFLNEIRSRRKCGSLVTVLDGMRVDGLPLELRQWQSFQTSGDDWRGIGDFIENALVGLRSRQVLDRSEQVLETGSKSLQKADMLSRVMAESRLTEMEIWREWFGNQCTPGQLRRVDDHIARLREILGNQD